MEDVQIVELYLARAENAIARTAEKYGRYCHAIAYNILQNSENSEECVADTWMQAWNSIPPRQPSDLRAFLGAITRNLSLKRIRKANAKKRGEGQVPLVLEELRECLPAEDNTKMLADEMVLIDIFNHFLASLPAERRKLFVRRYWYLHSVKKIADDFGISESKVKMSLLRARKKLKNMLEKEGVVL